MATMEAVNKTGKRKRGKCKVRNRSRRTPSSGGQMFPAVAPRSPEPEHKQDLSALHVACLYGELVSVQNLVATGQWWINSSDVQGHRPLHMVLMSATSPNASACLRYLLEHEADVDATTHSGQTPLHLAASKGLLNCVDILVKAGANVMMEDSMGHTPLDLARIWCHRKVARYLKNCLWQAEKKREMKERKLVQGLYRDLVNTVKQNNIDKKTICDEKMAEWANKKGLPLVKDFSSRAQRASQYHARCPLPDQTEYKPKQSNVRCKSQPDDLHKERSTLLKQPVASSANPWRIFMGLQPEKPLAEPDLRDSVTLRRDTSSRQLQYSCKWDEGPHPIPQLPLDVVERVLFPRAFPSRIATLQPFEPQSIDKVRHLGCPRGRSTSPWTEVAMHLAEVLEPGHY